MTPAMRSNTRTSTRTGWRWLAEPSLLISTQK
jgi:hypothetical protein